MHVHSEYLFELEKNQTFKIIFEDFWYLDLGDYTSCDILVNF